MGASNSTVIKNGDWEHRICWMEPPVAPEKSVPESPEKDPNVTNNNNFIRNASLTKSLRNYREKWKKLETQKSLEETSQGIELASLASSLKTTETEEMIM